MVLFPLLLVFTLAVSGYAKLRQPRSTASAMTNLGLDRWLPLEPVTRLLPWAELLLAAALLLLPGAGQLLVSLLALLLFSFYWLIIAWALARGNRTSCNCFGEASQGPISGYTLLRNSALWCAALLGLLGASQDSSSLLTRLLSLDTQGYLWLAGAATSCLTLWAIYRSEVLYPAPSSSSSSGREHRVILEDDDQLEDYQRLPIPFARLYLPSGPGQEQEQQTNLWELASSRARILLWVSPTCSHCHQVAAQIPYWQQQLPALGVHPVAESQQALEAMGFPAELEGFYDPSYRALQTLTGSGGTPAALALGMDGLLAAGPVQGRSRVLELMEDILAEFRQADQQAREGQEEADR